MIPILSLYSQLISTGLNPRYEPCYSPSLFSHSYSYIFYTTINYVKNTDTFVGQTVNAWDHKTESSAYYMIMYILIGIAVSVFTALNVLFSFLGGVNASRKIFKQVLESVMSSKIRFFDSTPIGRIMNRFSKDMEGVDQDLSIMASHVVRCSLGAISTTILIATITPGFLIFAFSSLSCTISLVSSTSQPPVKSSVLTLSPSLLFTSTLVKPFPVFPPFELTVLETDLSRTT